MSNNEINLDFGDIKDLLSKIKGKGEVRGYVFEQIQKGINGYIYKATNTEKKINNYEVFVRRYNKRFNNICYPSSKAFGIWAWTFHDLEKAITKFNLINKENYEI